MKNFSITLIIGLSLTVIKAQTTWNTALNAGATLKLGTSSNNVLDFWTNNTKKMTLGTDGKLKVNNLVATKVGPVYVDANGVFYRAIGGSGVGFSGPCLTDAMPWVQGGNSNPADNTIGTCSSTDFILKANNVQSVFLKPSGFVGVGLNNTNPLASLDVSDGVVSPGGPFHLKLYGDLNGAVESTGAMSLFYAGSNPNSSGFFIKEGSVGSSVNKLTILGTNSTFNTNITASGIITTSARFRSSSTILTDVAFEAYNTTSIKSNFLVLNSGKTQIGSQTGMTNAALLNLNLNSALTGASADNAIDVFDQVSNKVNFRVKASGWVFAREVNVQLSAFPDYVFSSNYKFTPLQDLENYVNINKHLPGVPTANEIEKNGANLGDLSKIQMEKIEELALYIIELKKELDALKKQVNTK